MFADHFNREEFTCKCQQCGFDTVDHELVVLLERVRRFFGQPVTIVSGCRCPEYNKKVGGAKRSQHLGGKAADIVVYSTKPESIYDYLCDVHPDSYGLGLYPHFLHVDVRAWKARWRG